MPPSNERFDGGSVGVRMNGYIVGGDVPGAPKNDGSISIPSADGERDAREIVPYEPSRNSFR